TPRQQGNLDFRRSFGMSVGRCALVFAMWGAGAALWSAESGPLSFKADIAPILAKNCIGCHGSSQQLSLLNLSSRAGALKGGQKGPSIVPGKAAGSPLYRRLTGQDEPSMPLGGKLATAEIAKIRKWIDAGAAWDDDSPGAFTPPPAGGGEKI